MDVRRATYGAAVRLAIVVSGIAAVVALTLETFGAVSTPTMLGGVMAVGFWVSWVQTGRVAQAARRSETHRITVVRTRHPIA